MNEYDPNYGSNYDGYDGYDGYQTYEGSRALAPVGVAGAPQQVGVGSPQEILDRGVALCEAATPGPVSYAVGWALGGAVLGLVGAAVYGTVKDVQPSYTKGAGWGTIAGAGAGLAYWALKIVPARDACIAAVKVAARL